MNRQEYTNKKTRLPVGLMLPGLTFLIFGVPLALAASPAVMAPSGAMRLLALLCAPWIFALAYVVLAAAFSLPFQKAIVPVKAPRNIEHFVYGPRRLYGLCWNAVFYFTPLYQAFLGLPLARKMLLRLFGYRGSSDIAVAPDAWIRDLPVLHFDDGVYLANKCTLGSNICLSNGWVFVDGITLGKGVMIGHQAVLGAGAVMGEGSEVGVNGMFGIRSRTGRNVNVGIRATVSHQVEIGDNAVIANASLIGTKVKISAGVKVPFGAVIPEGAILGSQEDVSRYFNAETRVLRAEQEALANLYVERLGDEPIVAMVGDSGA
jgi:carbonic anhydrase/acetyltransferase-like protein (isoleucine patch superfamily)